MKGLACRSFSAGRPPFTWGGSGTSLPPPLNKLNERKELI
jgi:hypothetical protein